ncbi:MAG: type II toxin-antitoxin system HicB family antitoxin [Chloroflexi bacterium]|nr:type II toxin-antitoxin system HicB family antitoxin [Chloroflexota bacterium]MCI0797557.1 type II toxin-antitoxin system HicB family antitoxin [Chloroflexota bacterium]
MKLYRLPLVLHEPSEDTEDKYLAEVPDLPGCRAWGDNAAEALENLQSLAAAFIESYRDRGDTLPQQVVAAVSETVEPRIISEILVAV